jgi:Septation protein etd1
MSNPQFATPEPALPHYTPPLLAGASTWTPYFDTPTSRKRHTVNTLHDGGIRTVSTPYLRRPTLVNARVIERPEPQDDIDGTRPWTSPPELAPVHRRQKFRRSLSSLRKTGRHRNFTDPTTRVFKEDVQGSILPTTRLSPLSPVSRSSTFNFDLPHGTPVFASSPPMQQLRHQGISAHKRISVAHSDLNTASSDNDIRVFTDDDSMDFQSDSAYDSLATRATASSHSGFRQPKIDTIFDEPIIEQGERGRTSLEELMQHSTLNEPNPEPITRTPEWADNVGMGITGFSDYGIRHDSSALQAMTPIKSSALSSIEELTATPVALGQRAKLIDIPSSSPPSVLRHPMASARVPKVHYPEDMDVDGEDSIDWSPKSIRDSSVPASTTPDSQVTRRGHRRPISPDGTDSNKRSSIFDWSEQHKDTPNGVIPRPRTVHGKHANEASRSRASGRKSTNTTHFRSQSVPVTRDSATDLETTPSAAAKFSTWGLGKGIVSEEWSDDFDFDDIEEAKSVKVVEIPQEPSQRDSMRSVKVPQTILDRQASVRLQFGQVQEFMILVEELKRLRSRGAVLDLLESQSKQLWDDAEHIINLATLNDEDETTLRPPPPISPDIFGEDHSPNSRRISVDERRDSSARRSLSNPATPPFGRPRGESLMQAKSFLQTIHQNRGEGDPSPASPVSPPREKLPFDTQDLRDLVTRAGVITRALKEIVRKAEGVALSPQRRPQKVFDPTFGQMFNPPEMSPCPPFRKPGLPKSRSANSYLGASIGMDENEIPSPLKFAAVIEAN